MPVRLTQEQFLEKARAVHGDKYDYSQAVYESSQKKVTEESDDYLSEARCVPAAGRVSFTRGWLSAMWYRNYEVKNGL